MKNMLVALCLAVIGCGEIHAPEHDPSAPDATQIDGSTAVTPDRGPHSKGVSAAGRRTTSAHFVLVSVTGQPTPVGARRSASNQFVHVPGILGDK
ncbi:MAG TPA: hypothetical protein VIV40_00255 [Kofleriaceae bacterium]